MTGNLDMLARAHGTDKVSFAHGYTQYYERHLRSRRHQIRSVLEIGVGGTSSYSGYETPAGGQSLQAWRAYFPNAEILGVDIYAKNITGSRLHFEQGDQSDPVFLASLIENYGPFDLIIDDGSHIGRHIIASMDALWEGLVPGGMYVIEDLGTAYHPTWEGGPPGTPNTGAALLKTKLDETLRRELDPFEPPIDEMHVYGEIAFLRKASYS